MNNDWARRKAIADKMTDRMKALGLPYDSVKCNPGGIIMIECRAEKTARDWCIVLGKFAKVDKVANSSRVIVEDSGRKHLQPIKIIRAHL